MRKSESMEKTWEAKWTALLQLRAFIVRVYNFGSVIDNG